MCETEREHEFYATWRGVISTAGELSRQQLESLAGAHERWPVSVRSLVVELLVRDLLGLDDAEWLEGRLGADAWIQEQLAVYRLLKQEPVDWRPLLLQVGSKRPNWSAHRVVEIIPESALQEAEALLLALSDADRGVVKLLRRRLASIKDGRNHG